MKKIILTILLLFVFFGVKEVNAAKQVFLGGTSDNMSSSNLEYTGIIYPGFGAYLNWGTSEASRQSPASDSGTLRNLYVELDGSPGTGNSYEFTLRVNGANSTLTCIISDDETTCADETHDVTVAQGDLLAMEYDPDSSPTGRDAKIISTEFEGDTDKASLYGGSIASDLSGGTRIFTYPNGNNGPSAASITKKMLNPIDGAIDEFCVNMGTLGDSTFIWSIYLNEAEIVASRITLDSGTTNNCISNLAIDIEPEDLVIISAIESSGTTGTYINSSYGYSVIADTDGESIISGTSDNTNYNAEYNQINGSDGTWQTEPPMIKSGGLTSFVVKYLYIGVHSGLSHELFTYPYYIRNNASNTSITCTLSGGAGACSDTTHTATYVKGDEIAIFIDKSGSGLVVRWATIQYVAPDAPTGDPDGILEVKSKLEVKLKLEVK